MQRREAIWGALPEAPPCGRPEGHNGHCRTVMAVRRKQETDSARLNRRRREQRERERQERRRAVLAAALREFDGYGRAAA